MHTVNVTHEGFEAMLEAGGILVLDFWAAWCGPCRAFAPIFEAAAERHSDITWGKIDTEAQPELAGAFGIRSIPTLAVFRDGVLVFMQPGMLPATALETLVEKVRELDMDEVRAQIEADTNSGAAGGAQERP